MAHPVTDAERREQARREAYAFVEARRLRAAELEMLADLILRHRPEDAGRVADLLAEASACRRDADHFELILRVLG